MTEYFPQGGALGSVILLPFSRITSTVAANVLELIFAFGQPFLFLLVFPSVSSSFSSLDSPPSSLRFGIVTISKSKRLKNSCFNLP